MTIAADQKFYKEAISRCKKNIEFIRNGNFAPKEKKDLIESYEKQIKGYKQNLMSFYQEYQQ